MRSIKSFRANILEKKVPKTKIRFPESSPRRCRGVVHHELPLHAVPLEQISNGFVVPRRNRTLITFPPIRPVEPAIIEVVTVISI